MRLIHYTNEKFSLEPREYLEQETRWHAKPVGFWVSIEGPDDWKWWCESEDYDVDCLTISYEVKLKKNANILHLKTPNEIHNFTQSFRLITEGSRLNYDTYQIQWNAVKELYQGIIIAPYQWECRLALECSWYYGWDCASGCIWDLTCIEEFKLIENEEKS